MVFYHTYIHINGRAHIYAMLVLLKSKNINLSEIDTLLKERSTKAK